MAHHTLGHALPHAMPHHTVAHHAGVIFIARVLLHLLPLSHLCGIIGIFLSPCPYRAEDESECDGGQHQNLSSHGKAPLRMAPYATFSELNRREIDPNELPQLSSGIIAETKRSADLRH
jgi:hypothetical protein